ncbi:HIPL1 protein-like [Telopea speciosissima]|uniref:HIPL1 protein-like n=1 Tax=Telopea speciosissima TaxID=54955 RepID=UPI001CC39445|nr:HIPL1 protein-like [Telopea speciosissima]
MVLQYLRGKSYLQTREDFQNPGSIWPPTTLILHFSVNRIQNQRKMGLCTELNILCLFGLWLMLLLGLSSSLPLCTDSTAPLTPKQPLTFCPYNGKVCCSSFKDFQLQRQFQSMNISDPACASIMKSILCANCDQFAAQLFETGSKPTRRVPVLCNSTISACSTQSSSAANNFCGKVWDTCFNVSMNYSPVTPSLEDSYGEPSSSTFSKLTDQWNSKSDFCEVHGGASGYDSVCFAGDPVSLNNNSTVIPPSGLCLEKVSNVTYTHMVGHPDGSNRVFLTDQIGRIWLATVPKMGSGETLVPTLFLDLSDKVYSDYLLGLMGIAFHPNFVQNGRFFVSFNCNKTKWGGCSGKCSCNSDVNCNPSNFTSTYGFPPCNYYSVISEFTANGTASAPSLATVGNPLEVRRIFSMGLPFENNHGGQILFGPSDGYLYLMMGDGGGYGDPYNFAQNKKSLLGKIMRFNVDEIPSATQINELGLWGNYSIPKDNAVYEDYELLPEIWALGLRNPWRCAFDPKRPSYFLCADDGEDTYEEVDLITKGGNYGWRVYEGPVPFNPSQSPGGNTSAYSINPIFPVMGYYHSSVNQNLNSRGAPGGDSGGAAIIGGYYYRSWTDPCMYGRYIYADFYGEAIWAGTENPENSGNFTSNLIPFGCAYDSPIQCSIIPGSPIPDLGYIYSVGEDNNKDVYIFTNSGTYRIVDPSRCNYICSNVNSAAVAGPSNCR